MSPPCWTCRGSGCTLYGTYVQMGGSLSQASTTVSIPAGLTSDTLITLQYGLRMVGGLPNNWTVTTGSPTNSSLSWPADFYVNVAPFDYTLMQTLIYVPPGARAVTLTFTAINVRPREVYQGCWCTQSTAALHCRHIVLLQCFYQFCNAELSILAFPSQRC